MSLNTLKQQGFRITKAREKLMSLFDGDHKTLTIKEIQQKLDNDADRATVYRNLIFLEKAGLLDQFKLEGETYYELAKLTHHHHLVCKNCKKITAIFFDEIEELVKNVTKKSGDSYDFMLTDHSLEFYGLCSNCKKL